MKDTFIFLQKGCFGVWRDRTNTTLVHTGLLSELPEGAELIGIAPTREGVDLAVRYYTVVNPGVKHAAA